MGNIIWLASYPKSGNTWFRAFLSSLLSKTDAPVDINCLEGGPIFSARAVFDSTTFIQSSDLLPDEIDNLRPLVYEELSRKAADRLFIKAHDAYTYLDNGRPLFPSNATGGAIYLIRNPLDVAVSYANHLSCDLEKAISLLNDVGNAMCANPKTLPISCGKGCRGGAVTSSAGSKPRRLMFISSAMRI